MSRVRGPWGISRVRWQRVSISWVRERRWGAVRVEWAMTMALRKAGCWFGEMAAVS